MISDDKIQETVPTRAYLLGDITYVPHYSLPCFVGPGYGRHNMKEYNETELLDMGAELVIDHLWMRRLHSLRNIKRGKK